MLNKETIKNKIREIGVKEGDLVLLHSCYFCLGPVEGGIDTIINAFLETIGKEGTLVMPSFTLNQPFDKKNARSETGYITEKFRIKEGVIRSNHPTHSVISLGPKSEEIIKDHEKTSGTGYNSPFHKISKLKGKICLISNKNDFHVTSLHTAQILSEMPYAKLYAKKEVYDKEGNKKVIRLKENPIACNTIDLKLKDLVKKEGILKETNLGNAYLQFMDADKFLDFTINHLKSDSSSLVCKDPNCKSCAYINWKLKKESFLRFYSLIIKDKLKTIKRFHKIFK